MKVPRPLALATPVNGPAAAIFFGSVSTVWMLAAALRVGVTLKLSPALNAPPLSARVKPSITGGGLVVVLNAPRSVPSERLTV
ncbi:hypothetical protein D3C78_1488150 [compost metagenome]